MTKEQYKDYDNLKDWTPSVGEWVVHKHREGLRILRIESFDVLGDFVGSGLGFDGEWYNGSLWHISLDELRPATKEEIEEALFKEAERRIGDKKVRCLSRNNLYKIYWSRKYRIPYNPDTDSLWATSEKAGCVKVYSKGKFAEIVTDHKDRLNAQSEIGEK